MQSCTLFAAWTNWLTRELDKTDPDLTSGTKPPTMTDVQWRHFQAHKAATSRSRQRQHEDADASTIEDGEGGVKKLAEIIRKWETNFSRHLQILLDALNHYAATETVVLLSLCARLSTANQGTEYSGLKADEDSAVTG
jgi:gamma-tubulin complex component 2